MKTIFSNDYGFCHVFIEILIIFFALRLYMFFYLCTIYTYIMYFPTILNEKETTQDQCFKWGLRSFNSKLFFF